MEQQQRDDSSADFAVLIGTGSDAAPAPAEAGTTTSTGCDALALLPESTVGHMQVVRLIGCGKVSESWFGVDAANQREVVVKVLRKPWAGDIKLRAYFEQQLKTIAHLKHPNLANILDVGTEDDLLYWVTEWVKGGSVWPKIRRKGPMDISLAINVIDQAAAGLAHGAVANLVHGGLKPENVLMERSGAVKVSDLGVEYAARQLVSGTPASSALWTAEFMAPEVRSGAIPDVRSDVFSLGAILLYLVAGVVPHDGLLDATSPRITPALRQLLIGMTAPKPGDRIPDYGELRAALADAEAGNTSVFRSPPSNWQADTQNGEVVPLFAAETVILEDPQSNAEISYFDTVIEEEPIIGLPPPRPTTPLPDVRPETLSAAPLYTMPSLAPTPSPDAVHIEPAAPAELRLKSPDKVASHKSRRLPLYAALTLTALGAAGGGAWYLAQQQTGNNAAIATAAGSTASPTHSAAPADPQPPAPQPVFTPAIAPAIAAEPKQEIPQPAISASQPMHPPGVDPSAIAVPTSTLPGVAPGVAASAPIPMLPTPGAQAVTEIAATAPAADHGVIIVDNAAQGALELEPPAGWRASSETRASYAGGSLVAQAGAGPRKATFFADIPADGRYQLYMWWVARSQDVRSPTVPTTVYTASGPINIAVDQVNTDSDFNLIGTYYLKAGKHQPVVAISTDGIANPSGTVHVSIDALKIIPLTN